MAVPTIPAILTDANWQKEKGIVAKLVKSETGIGELMKKLAAAYGTVDWTKFDPYVSLDALKKSRTAENIDFVFNLAKAEAAKLEPIRKAANALRDRAKAISAEWAKSKVIPSSSRKHVDAIVAASELFATQMKSPDGGLFERIRKELADNEVKGRSMIATWVSSIKTGAAAVNTTPTYETYNAKMYQKVRGLGTAIGNIPQYKAKWSPIFGNAGFSKGDYIVKTDNAEAIKNKVKAILTQLTKFESEL